MGTSGVALGWRAVLVTEEAGVLLLAHVVAWLLRKQGPRSEGPVRSPKGMESRMRQCED